MKIEQFLTKVKPGTLAIIIVVIAVALYFLLKKNKPDPTTSPTDNINVDSNNLTYSTTELDFKTSQLYDAMARIGTDFSTILDVFQSLMTSDELLYIIKTFGVRRYALGGSGGSLLKAIYGNDENLIGWLHEELSSNELAQVKFEFDRLGVSMI